MKRFDYPYYFILAAVAYAIAGMGLGLYQHLSKNMQYVPLHGHVASLGWLSLAVTGLLYRSFPGLGASRLAPWHFAVAQLGALLLNGGLVLVYLQATRAPIYIGTVLAPLGYVLLFVMFATRGRTSADGV